MTWPKELAHFVVRQSGITRAWIGAVLQIDHRQFVESERSIGPQRPETLTPVLGIQPPALGVVAQSVGKERLSATAAYCHEGMIDIFHSIYGAIAVLIPTVPRKKGAGALRSVFTKQIFERFEVKAQFQIVVKKDTVIVMRIFEGPSTEFVSSCGVARIREMKAVWCRDEVRLPLQ